MAHPTSRTERSWPRHRVPTAACGPGWGAPMRIGMKPESPVERVVARLNLVPQPLIETQMAFTLARVVMAATKLGLFEALAPGPMTAAGVAEQSGTDPEATGKILFALAAGDYLEIDGDRYSL